MLLIVSAIITNRSVPGEIQQDPDNPLPETVERISA